MTSTDIVALLKRSLDVVAALIGLAIAIPLLPLVALLIVLDSRGPVFYRQRRALSVRGRGPEGEIELECFHMWKLRTMRVDAEAGTGAVLAGENDPRITRVGRVLRKTRLDEVPQLWHVLIGEMSLVGPRPERPELIAHLARTIPLFEERARDLKPGITGLSQVKLRYSGAPPPGSPAADVAATHAGSLDPLAADMAVKLAYDMAYAAAITTVRGYLRTELEVLVRTPFVMLSAQGR